jgi:predicted ABC-type ATPase
MPSPIGVFIAGPNGAGKSTLIDQLAPGWSDFEFVLADVHAAAEVELGVPQGAADINAARHVIGCFRRLISEPHNFVNETNLVDRHHLRSIREMRDVGYRIELIFLALEHPDLAVARVAQRVAANGHPVPEPVVRRRWRRGLELFFDRYQYEVDSWTFYDTTDGVIQVASGGAGPQTIVYSDRHWDMYMELARAGGASTS